MIVHRTDRGPARLPECLWPDDGLERRVRELVRDVFGSGPVDRVLDRHRPLQIEQFLEPGKAVFRVEAPGLDPAKDIDVSVTHGILTVRTTRRGESEEEHPSGWYSEFHHGAAQRSMRLPDNVTAGDVTASYRDGIPRVEVPVAEQSCEPVKIDVATS